MWGTIISAGVSLATSYFKGDGISKAVGVGNGMTFYAAIAGGVWWFFNGAESWQTVLNGRELIGVIAAGSMLLEWVRNLKPPSQSAASQWRP